MVSMHMTHTSLIRISAYSAYISQQYILRIGHYFCIYSALFGLRNTLFVSIQYTTSVNYGLKEVEFSGIAQNDAGNKD